MFSFNKGVEYGQGEVVEESQNHLFRSSEKDSITVRAASHYFYCDRTIEDGSKCVLLLGGFTGYQNFGDILQLKHAISFHKNTTGLTPVVICDIESIVGPDYPAKLYKIFAVDCIIFYSREYYDVEALNLKVMESPVRIPYFHIYGGGILNKYWGEWYLSLVPDVIDFFGVGHYLLSGQQIDRRISNKLQHFFEMYKPLLIGCRDEESLDIVKEIAPDAAAYSFDDAFECVGDIAHNISLAEEDTRRQTILLHLNLSLYVHDKTTRDCLDVFKDALEKIRNHYDKNNIEIILLIAYNDSRVTAVGDTPVVIQSLEDEFDFPYVRIVNMANLALSYKIGCGLDVPLRISPAALLITTSYHMAMLGLTLGLRTYLFKGNLYYSQKHAGLHLEELDLEAFLKGAGEAGWAERDRRYFREAREKWRALLEAAYKKEPVQERHADALPRIKSAQPFAFKLERNDVHEILKAIVKDKDAHIGNLEQHIINLEAQIKEKDKQIQAMESRVDGKKEVPEAVGSVERETFGRIIGAPLREIPAEYRHIAVKILIISGIGGAPYLYRCLNMKEELYFCGYHHVACKYVQEVTPETDARDYNLIILNRVCGSPAPAIIELINRCKVRGVIVIFSTDGLVTDHATEGYLGIFKYLSKSQLYNFHRGVDESRNILRLCDAAIATTNYLRKCILPFNKNVYVLENALNDKQVKKADRLLAGIEEKKKRQEIVIGYFSGWPHDHDFDFATVSDALRKVLQKYHNARLRIVGFLDIGEEFRGLEDRVEQVDFVPFEVLPALIADVDINIAPLADNPHKRSKSAIKFLEAGILGVPTVAANLDPYNEIIVHGEDGLLCSNEDDWFSNLSALIEEPHRRYEIGMKAYAKVKAGHTTFMRSRTCREVLQSIIEKSCGETHRLPYTAGEESPSSPHGREELTRKYIKGRGIRIGELDPQANVQADIAASVEELSSIGDSKYDFLIASHILQRCANPVKALVEFHRVTKKHDSFIYLALPNTENEESSDKGRAVTPVSHFADEYFMREPERKENHVFTEGSFLALLDFMDKELYVRFEVADRYSDDYEFIFILKPVY